jgi:hypothetical protein
MVLSVKKSVRTKIYGKIAGQARNKVLMEAGGGGVPLEKSEGLA